MGDGLDDGAGQSTGRSWALPIELRFLLGRGFSFDTLVQASLLAQRTGVTGEAFLIASEIIDEETYYRALADELGLSFRVRARVSQHSRFPDSIRAGIAPLAAPASGFLLAPRGLGLIRLLQQRRRMGTGIVITTPTHLHREVLRVRGPSIARLASHALPDRRRDLSFRDGWTVGQFGTLCLLLLWLLLSLALGPRTPLLSLALAGTPVFLGMVVTRLAACLLPHAIEPSNDPPRAEDAALPIYTVIVALYRESDVLPKLVAALRNLDYPPAKLDIKLVIEADDRETQAALAGLRLPCRMEIVVAPPGYPRTKPRALNVALPLARGELTVIYDAEDVPDRRQLRRAAATFAELPENVACCQARLTIDNTRDTWLCRFFTIEYAALFDVINPGLAAIGCPIPLGGTSNHFRTRALRDMGGWDAWNVTEDADLGIRLARLGYGIADLPSSTLEEAPISLAEWMRQRTRWMKGFIQTCISHSRQPLRTTRELGFWRAYGALTVTFGTVMSALSYPFFTVLVVMSWSIKPASAWGALWRAFSTTLFVLGFAAVYGPATVALARRRLLNLLPWALLLPLYYLLVSLAAWRAVWEMIWFPFRWNKTRHGLARTSRQDPAQKHQARADRTMSLKTAPP